MTSGPNFWAYHLGGPLLHPRGCRLGAVVVLRVCMGWLRLPDTSGQAHWLTTAAPPSSLMENEPTKEKTLSFSCRWAARFLPESRASSPGSSLSWRPITPPWLFW